MAVTIITTITAITIITTATARPAAETGSFDYLRDPDAIYRRSFELIEQELDLSRIPKGLHPMVRRIVHACGMTDIIDDLAWSGEPVEAGRRALTAGATILCDSTMVAAGIMRSSSDVICTLNAPEIGDLAHQLGTTRSAAAVELWHDRLNGAIVVIGNAPTALFHLLERLEIWDQRPSLILAFPVGFVGAVESKEALIAHSRDIPFLTLGGRRGGSAMAAAAVNALVID